MSLNPIIVSFKIFINKWHPMTDNVKSVMLLNQLSYFRNVLIVLVDMAILARNM
jgi:hypothetical protein